MTAIAKPGCKFLYWQGDVNNPTANSTTVYLDTPKIIIAVFEPAEPGLEVAQEKPESQSATVGGGGAGDDLITTASLESIATCICGNKLRLGSRVFSAV